MALTKIVKINDKLSWALWKIDAPWTDLLHLLQPNDEEYQLLLKIRHPQKKAEFLAGRLALRDLLTSIGIHEFEMYKDSHGKPHIKKYSIHISLANSYPHAAAIVHLESPVGIDIEKPSDKLIRVQHKFLHASEWDTFSYDLEKLCLAWCAKESLYKLHGRKNLSFKANILVQHLYYPKEPMLEAAIVVADQHETYTLHIVQEENFFIAFNV